MGRYIGIDPGASGSLCLLDTDEGYILFQDTPGPLTTPYSVFSWIHSHNIGDVHNTEGLVRVIGIEEVGPIPKTHGGSNWKFGFNVGMIRGIAECTGVGVDLIKPKAWQKGIGLVTTKKRTSAQLKREVAETMLRLYPNAEVLGPKGGLLDGRSDALAIAHCMMLKYEGAL